MSTLPTTRKELEDLIARGKRPSFLFFWGHTPRNDGQLGHECFSQWYVAPFTVEGQRYATAEHYMMAEKARLFGDSEHREQIWQASSPAAAKALGRAVRGFDDASWKQERVAIVIAGNRAKFSQHPALCSHLLATGTKVLVEAAPRDRIWGIGLGANNPHSENPLLWRGQNLLGFALMQVRDQLAAD